MKKAFLILVVFLGACNTKSPTQSIVNAGTERIERAETAVKKTETLAQCKATAQDALISAKSDLLNAGESAKAETDQLESDIAGWKIKFFGLLAIIGIAATLWIKKKLTL